MTSPSGGSAIMLLATYPHVAGCLACRVFATEYLDSYPPAVVLPATLAHHEAGHDTDPLLAACQHFAIGNEPTLI
jgi:hypothetical protein